jgi:hypothetical protein
VVCHDKLILALQGRVGRKLPTPIQSFVVNQIKPTLEKHARFNGCWREGRRSNWWTQAGVPQIGRWGVLLDAVRIERRLPGCLRLSFRIT